MHRAKNIFQTISEINDGRSLTYSHSQVELTIDSILEMISWRTANFQNRCSHNELFVRDKMIIFSDSFVFFYFDSDQNYFYFVNRWQSIFLKENNRQNRKSQRVSHKGKLIVQFFSLIMKICTGNCYNINDVNFIKDETIAVNKCKVETRGLDICSSEVHLIDESFWVRCWMVCRRSDLFSLYALPSASLVSAQCQEREKEKHNRIWTENETNQKIDRSFSL